MKSFSHQGVSFLETPMTLTVCVSTEKLGPILTGRYGNTDRIFVKTLFCKRGCWWQLRFADRDSEVAFAVIGTMDKYTIS